MVPRSHNTGRTRAPVPSVAPTRHVPGQRACRHVGHGIGVRRVQAGRLPPRGRRLAPAADRCGRPAAAGARQARQRGRHGRQGSKRAVVRVVGRRGQRGQAASAGGHGGRAGRGREQRHGARGAATARAAERGRAGRVRGRWDGDGQRDAAHRAGCRPGHRPAVPRPAAGAAGHAVARSAEPRGMWREGRHAWSALTWPPRAAAIATQVSVDDGGSSVRRAGLPACQ
mmetsp:Transcript_25900/g.65907  ORF Transcript_25900/g.65907 Transcript_25900/m.65907 type:complete len:227 (-) Transcript_25900:1358-2038(-)